MRTGCLDEMIEFAIEEIATGDSGRISSVVRAMVSRWQTEPALAICFAITSAAAHLEDNFADSDEPVGKAYQFAAILASDIFAIESMGQIPATGQHLLHFWRRSEPYFLDL